MFSFLSKNDYTSKCTKILNKETGLDPLIAQAFIEDFKPIFDEEYSKNNNPEQTLINSGLIVIQHVLEESIKEIKVNNKCRIFDKVAVKINKWSLTKINTDDPIRNKIEKSLEPFTKKK
tara:strand:+ start:72 stop:428 length:357 start_codon:yes stop_codon:yes gene_type:complete